MKSFFSSLLAILLVSGSLCAQTLQPFDRLSKANITLTPTLGASGAKLEGRGTMGVSTTKDFTTSKQIFIKIPVVKSNLEEITIEAYGVYKNYDTKKVRFEKLAVQKDSGQEYSFKIATSRSVERVKVEQYVKDPNSNTYTKQTVDTGRSVNHGEKIAGWFARAISNSTIIGITGSSPQMEVLAADPKSTSNTNAKVD